MLLFGEVYDEDCGLACHRKKQDQPDLGVNVVADACQMQEPERPRHDQRDYHDDRERQKPASVKRREKQEDEQDREPENDRRLIARLLFLIGHFAPLILHGRREYLCGDCLHDLHCLF